MPSAVKRIFLIAILFALACVPSSADEPPARMVSLSPSLTHIVYALGEFDRIVGVTIYSEFPPEAANLPNVGGWVNPNFEAVVALRPDAVLLMKDQDAMFGDKLRSLGLRTVIVNGNDSVADIIGTVTFLGRLLNREDKAKEVTGHIEASLASVKKKTENLPRKKVLLVVGRNPGTLEDIYVIGRNNYINELIEIAGGENVVENERFSIKLTREAILALDPDVIIEVNHEQPDKEEEILGIWKGLPESRAVRNGEVYILPTTVVLHPSQIIAEGAGVLAGLLHPEAGEGNGNDN
ncbi:MAG: ABC transporter substrate-binding protein [Candidatus Dadabacteria bacterium]|nr:ABC transporter substrate-binding protein [Candidatus Dadabacteria bacterium]